MTMEANREFDAASALKAGMILTTEQMAALRAAAYPSMTPKRPHSAPHPSNVSTPEKRSRIFAT